jgi:hypothetical protein
MTKQGIEFRKGMVIAFGFNYNGGKPTEIIVSTITEVYNDQDQVLTHFNYGHRSLGEFIKKDEIVAVGDHESGTENIKGWTGKFVILNRKLYNELNK